MNNNLRMFTATLETSDGLVTVNIHNGHVVMWKESISFDEQSPTIARESISSPQYITPKSREWEQYLNAVSENISNIVKGVPISASPQQRTQQAGSYK